VIEPLISQGGRHGIAPDKTEFLMNRKRRNSHKFMF